MVPIGTQTLKGFDSSTNSESDWPIYIEDILLVGSRLRFSATTISYTCLSKALTYFGIDPDNRCLRQKSDMFRVYVVNVIHKEKKW